MRAGEWHGEHRLVVVDVLGPHEYEGLPLPPAPARRGATWRLGSACSAAEARRLATAHGVATGAPVRILRCRMDAGTWEVTAQWKTPLAERGGSTVPQAMRKRRVVSLSLSDAARERLEALADPATGGASGVVERLVLAHLPEGK